MAVRTAAGLEQGAKRGPGALRPTQASGGDGQNGADKGRLMFRKTGWEER